MELCGVLHAYMNTPVHVVSSDDFASWVTKQQGITGGTSWLSPLQGLPIALFGNGGKRFS
jgi:heme/copper-type cytochrome/quinol oxidase subunit 2